jgi:hypothetical protein
MNPSSRCSGKERALAAATNKPDSIPTNTQIFSVVANMLRQMFRQLLISYKAIYSITD